MVNKRETSWPGYLLNQVGESSSKGPRLKDRNFLTEVAYTRVEAGTSSDSGEVQRYDLQRRMVVVADGAMVLPYFQQHGVWQLVFVEQFRVAIGVSTVEAAGGVVEDETPRATMVRELSEEAGIVVVEERVVLCFNEYFLPSLLSATAWGGIVEIAADELPSQTVLRSGCCLRVLPLFECFEKKRRGERVVFDLWTSRLIDEVHSVVTAS